MLTANKSSNDKKWQITTEKMTEKGKKPNYVGVRFKISYFAKITLFQISNSCEFMDKNV